MADTKSTAQIEIEAKLGSAIKSFGSLLESMEKIEAATNGTGEAIKKLPTLAQKLRGKFPKIAKSVDAVNRSIKTMGALLKVPVRVIKAISSAFGKVGHALQSVNAGVQILRTGFDALRGLGSSVLGVISSGIANIENATPFDPMIIRLRHLQSRLGALLGQAVRPLVEGFLNTAKSLDPLLRKLSEFFSNETKTISKAVEKAFVNIGNTLLQVIVPALGLLGEFIDAGGDLFQGWQIDKVNKQIKTTEESLKNLEKPIRFLAGMRGDVLPIKQPKDASTQITALRKNLDRLIEKRQKLIDTPITAESFGVGKDSLETIQGIFDKFEEGGGFKVSVDVDSKAEANLVDFNKTVLKAIDMSNDELVAFGHSFTEVLGIADKDFQSFLDTIAGDPAKIADVEKLLDLPGIKNKVEEVTTAFDVADKRLRIFIARGDDLGDFRTSLEPLIKLFPEVGKGFDFLVSEINRIGKLTIPLDEQKRAIDDLMTIWDGNVMLARDRLGLIEGIFARFKGQQQEVTATLKAEGAKQRAEGEKQLAFWQQIGAGMGSALGSGISGLVTAYNTTAETAEDAQIRIIRAQQQMTLAILSSVQAAVTAYAVETAVRYASSVGAVSGIAAAITVPVALGAMFGLLSGWINSQFEGRIQVQEGTKAARLKSEKGTETNERNKLTGEHFFARGGFVSGGIKGVDSVPIMAMPGEYVMSLPEVRGMETFLDRFGAQGQAIQPAANTNTQHTRNEITNNNEFVIEFNAQQLPNKTETKKWVKETIVPALRQLQAGGY